MLFRSGRLKQALLKLGWPAEDWAGYVDGEAHAIALDQTDWTLVSAGRTTHWQDSGEARAASR